MSKLQLYKHLNEILSQAGTFDPKSTDGGAESGEATISEEEKKTLQSIMRRLGGMQGYDSFVGVLVEEGLAMSPECEKSLMDEVVKGEETIGTLREELDALRKEYTALFRDMESLQDSVVTSNVASRKTKEAHLGLLMALKDNKAADKDSLAKLTDEVLDTNLMKLTGEVDIVKITDKLGDGMSRVPTEKVVLPAGKVELRDNTKQQLDQKSTEKRQIEETVKRLLVTGGNKAVDMYFNELIRLGKLPKDSE
jgi:hypothetical protein